MVGPDVGGSVWGNDVAARHVGRGGRENDCHFMRDIWMTSRLEVYLEWVERCFKQFRMALERHNGRTFKP